MPKTHLKSIDKERAKYRANKDILETYINKQAVFLSMDEETNKPDNKLPSKPDNEKTSDIMPSEVPKDIQEEPKQVAQPTQAFVPKKKETPGEAKPSKWQKIKRFGVECKRVLRVTRKPDKIEFKTIVKISGIGIIIIGVIGFLIHFIKELLF